MSSNPEQQPEANGVPGDDPGGEAAAQSGEVGRLASELAALQSQLTEARDAQLRAYAEMENVRRRAQRDVESAHKFAVERFAADLVEVRDSLELGIAAAGSAPETARFVEGMQATLRLIDKAFQKAGILIVDPANEPFNPELHEAMATQAVQDQPAGRVLAVVQKGFTLNGRLLRPARVVIARAPDAAN